MLSKQSIRQSHHDTAKLLPKSFAPFASGFWEREEIMIVANDMSGLAIDRQFNEFGVRWVAGVRKRGADVPGVFSNVAQSPENGLNMIGRDRPIPLDKMGQHPAIFINQRLAKKDDGPPLFAGANNSTGLA
jgi:hypothetical protein